MKSIIVEYSSYDSLYRAKESLLGWEISVEHKGEGYSSGLENTLRSLTT